MRETMLDVNYEDVATGAARPRGLDHDRPRPIGATRSGARRWTRSPMRWCASAMRPDVRVVVITAAGSALLLDRRRRRRLLDALPRRHGRHACLRRALEKTFAEMIHCPKPIIHRINGDCVGGANAFHLAADIAVMSTHGQAAAGRHHDRQRRAASGRRSGGRGRRRQARQRNPDVLKPVGAELALKWGAVNAIASPMTNSMPPCKVDVDKLARVPRCYALHQGGGERCRRNLRFAR